MKRHAPEVKTIPRIAALNDYLDQSIQEIKGMVREIGDTPNPGWEELNELFLSQCYGVAVDE